MYRHCAIGDSGSTLTPLKLILITLHLDRVSIKSTIGCAEFKKGVAYTGINLADLRKLPVDLPPIEEQREIVQHIRSAHSRATALANQVERARALLDRLDQAILAKAFRGELVSLDRSDHIGEEPVAQESHPRP
jgi:hypothetical protein